MANGKAPGPSGVTSDAFCTIVWCKPDPEKEGLNKDAEFLCDYLTETLQLFWLGELDIETWKEGTLSPVPKK
eukprot:11045157-Ditylum_brightwellii.AAC.1